MPSFENQTEAPDKGPSLEQQNDIIQKVNKKIDLLLEKQELRSEDGETIKDVLDRHSLREMLLEHPEGLPALQSVSVGEDGSVERLRLLCQGVWLESTNTFAIEENGELAISIQGNELYLSPEIEAQERKALFRQAILRQIEREIVFDTNGLKGESSDSPKRILDIGSGTLIGSSMMRKRFPQGEITAVEPGFISSKTQNVAQNNGINLIHAGIESIETDKKYDVILLHFVLEHSVDQARELLRQALRRISDTGRISIAVPNFNAFHRELETLLQMNKRDPVSRLSLHDNLSGHQIIFSKENLVGLIKEVMEEEGINLPIQASTVLPRPFAFNNLSAMNRHRDLLELEKGGSIDGMEDSASVLCITIGVEEESAQNIQRGSGEKTKQIFFEILNQYIDKNPEQEEIIKRFIAEKYPSLLT